MVYRNNLSVRFGAHFYSIQSAGPTFFQLTDIENERIDGGRWRQSSCFERKRNGI